MPYRRIPKTDQARLKALKAAIELETFEIDKIPTSFSLINAAKSILPKFETLVQQYTLAYDTLVVESRKARKQVKNARMYISHFIQILNFAVQRDEIKAKYKAYYGLEPNDFTLPDLSSEQALAEWGEKIIKGEHQRIREGGIALQFPNIQKVSVHYEIFKDYLSGQKIRRSSSERSLSNVAEKRDEVDDIIKKIWDDVEAYYSECLPYERFMNCKKCGVIYYYRRGEKKLTPKVDNDIRLNEKLTQTIDFGEEY